MFFETYLLCSYDKLVGSRLLVDCKCYEVYRSEAIFIEEIINKRQSYLGCLAYESKTRKRIGHRYVPVMLGSWIDFRIRGRENVLASRAQWGTVILKGMPKIYASFSTFDALSLHVRKTFDNKTIEWFTYVNGDGLAIRYENKTVTWTYRQNTQISYNSDNWVHLLNEANPFVKNRMILASEYVDMFETILRYPYDMNDLTNRQIINGAEIMKRYIDFNLSKRLNKKGTGVKKMSTVFEQGSMYIVLGKQNNSCESTEWSRNYSQQTYDNTLHEGRSNKAAHFLQNVTRASNDAVRNSKALSFPKDAFGYFCTLNTKDLKSAGEQNVLADYVIMTEESDAVELYTYISKYARFLEILSASEPLSSSSSASTVIGTNCSLIIDGFITDCNFVWSFEAFLRIKRHFPHVTTKYYKPYILFSTRASIPIKYSDVHDAFFSPAETVEYQIKYPELSILSLTAKQLDPMGMRKTPPAKLTVAINNSKGCVANRINDFHNALMRMSLGTTCYMNSGPDECRRILDLAVLEPAGTQDTSNFQKVWKFLDKEFQLKAQLLGSPLSTPLTVSSLSPMIMTTRFTVDNDEERVGIGGGGGNSNSISSSVVSSGCYKPFCDTDRRKAMNALLKRAYNLNQLMIEYRVGAPYVRERNVENKRLVEDYVSTVFGSNNFDTPSVRNLSLWAAFGNVQGYCIEDGVVLDRKTVDSIPPIYYNACITVDFTFATTKQPDEARFMAVDESRLSVISEETCVGCLISEHEVFVKNSKHCRVMVAEIGNHFYYLLHFLPKKNNTYVDLKVTHIRSSKVITAIITGVHEAKVGTGTKVANAFGQKNLCSYVCDLSNRWGVTRDGRKVHAQIIYSDVSLIGRIAAGQIFNALTNDDLAIGPNGEIIARIDLVIHALHPYTNIKEFNVKVDTLTNVNGFDSQCMPNVSLALRTERVYERVLQLIGLHGFDIDIIGRKFAPLEGFEIAECREAIGVDGKRRIYSNNADNDPEDDDDDDEIKAKKRIKNLSVKKFIERCGSLPSSRSLSSSSSSLSFFSRPSSLATTTTTTTTTTKLSIDTSTTETYGTASMAVVDDKILG